MAQFEQPAFPTFSVERRHQFVLVFGEQCEQRHEIGRVPRAVEIALTKCDVAAGENLRANAQVKNFDMRVNAMHISAKFVATFVRQDGRDSTVPQATKQLEQHASGNRQGRWQHGKS